MRVLRMRRARGQPPAEDASSADNEEGADVGEDGGEGGEALRIMRRGCVCGFRNRA